MRKVQLPLLIFIGVLALAYMAGSRGWFSGITGGFRLGAKAGRE